MVIDNNTHNLALQIFIPKNILSAIMRYGLGEDKVFDIDPTLFGLADTSSLKLRYCSPVYHHGKAGTFYRAQVTFFIRKDKRMVIETDHRIKDGIVSQRIHITRYSDAFYPTESSWREMIKKGISVTHTISGSDKPYTYNIQFIETNTTYSTNKDYIAAYFNQLTGVAFFLGETTYGGTAQAKKDLEARWHQGAYDPSDNSSRQYPSERYLKANCETWIRENQGDLLQEFNNEMDSKMEAIVNTLFRAPTNTCWGKYYDEILAYSNILATELGFTGLEDYNYHVLDISKGVVDSNENIINYNVRCKVRVQSETAGSKEVVVVVPRKYLMPGATVLDIETALKTDVSLLAKEKLTEIKSEYVLQKKTIEAHIATLSIFIRDNIYDDVTTRNIDSAYSDIGNPTYITVTTSDVYNENLDYYVKILGDFYTVPVDENTYEAYCNSIGLYTVATFQLVTYSNSYSSIKKYYRYNQSIFSYEDITTEVNATNFDAKVEDGLYYMVAPEPVFYQITDVDYIEEENVYYIKIGSEYQEVILTDENQDNYVRQGLYCRIKPNIPYYKVLANQPFRDIDYYLYAKNPEGVYVYIKIYNLDEATFKLYQKSDDIELYSTTKNLVIYKQIDASYPYNNTETYYVKNKNLEYVEVDVTSDNYEKYLEVGLYIVSSDDVSTDTGVYYEVEQYSLYDNEACYYVKWDGKYLRVNITESQFNTFISYGLYSNKEPKPMEYFIVDEDCPFDRSYLSDDTVQFYLVGTSSDGYVKYTLFQKGKLTEEYFNSLASSGSFYSNKVLQKTTYYLVGPEDSYLAGAKYYISNGGYISVSVNSSNFNTLRANNDLYCTTKQPSKYDIDEDGNVIETTGPQYYKANANSIYMTGITYYRKNSDGTDYDVISTVNESNFLAYVSLGLYTKNIELKEKEPTYYPVDSWYKYETTAHYYMAEWTYGSSASSANYIELENVDESNFSYYKTIGIYTDINQEYEFKPYKMNQYCLYDANESYYILVSGEYVNITSKVNRENFYNYITVGLYRTKEVTENKKTITADMVTKLSSSAEFNPEEEYYSSVDGKNFTYEEGINESNFKAYISSIGLYVIIDDSVKYYRASANSDYDSSYTYYVLNSDGITYTEVSVTIDNFDNYVKVGLYTTKKLPTKKDKDPIKVESYYTFDSSAKYYVYNGVAYTRVDIEDVETFDSYILIGLYVDTDHKQDRPTTWYKATEKKAYDSAVAYYIYDASEEKDEDKYKRIWTVTEDNFYVYVAMGIYTKVELKDKKLNPYLVNEYYVFDTGATYYFKNSTTDGAYQFVEVDVPDEETFKTLRSSGYLYSSKQQFPYFRVTTSSIYDNTAKYYTLNTSTGVYTLIDNMNASLFKLRAKLGTLYCNKQLEVENIEQIKVESYYSYNSNATYYEDMYGKTIIDDITEENFNTYKEIGIWTDLEQQPGEAKYYRATERSQYLTGITYYREVESVTTINGESTTTTLHPVVSGVNSSNFYNYVAIGLYTKDSALPILSQQKIMVESWYEYDSSAKYYWNYWDNVDNAIDIDEDKFNDYKAVGIYVDVDHKQTQKMNYKKITSDKLYSASANYYVYKKYTYMDNGVQKEAVGYVQVFNVTESNFDSYVILGLYTTSDLLTGNITREPVLSYYSYDDTATYWIFNKDTYEEVEVDQNNFDTYKKIGIYTNKHQDEPEAVNYYPITHRHIFNPAYNYFVKKSNGEYTPVTVTITNYRAYVDVGIYSSPYELEIDQSVNVYKVEKWYTYNANATYYSDGYGYETIEVTADTFEPYLRIGIWTDVEQERELKYYLCNDTCTFDALETYYIMVSDNTYIEVSVNESNFSSYMSLGLYRKTEVQEEESPLSYEKCNSNSKYDDTARYFTKGTDMVMKRITSVNENNFSTYVSTVGLYIGLYS